MRHFEGGATRDDSDDKLDFEGFLNPQVLQLFAEYMHKHRVQADGKLRDSDNWQKGMPRAEYVKSLWRHFHEVWTSHRLDCYDPIMMDALCAMLFNVQGLMLEIIKGRSINGPTENS